MSFRRRIEESETLANLFASGAGTYLRYCNRKIAWQTEGLDDLQAALRDGPILLVMWHSRSIMGAIHWPVADGPLSSLFDKSPIGRISGALQRQVGLQAMEMSRKDSNRTASRQILRRVKEGVSIGMTGDGPLGPALSMKSAPIEWARVTQMPVFGYAFSCTRGRRLQTWDQMLLPYPAGQGAIVFRRFEGAFDRRGDDAALKSQQQALRQFLNETTAWADQICGLPAGP